MNARSMSTRRRAITRLEVLVLLVTLCITLALFAQQTPQFGAAAQLHGCLNNLRRIGQMSATVASFGAQGVPHLQSTAGELNWIGLGAWDWGGANGTHPYHGPSTGTCSNYCLTAETRPYNRALNSGEDYEVYHCPSDTGVVQNPNIQPQNPDGPGDFPTSVFLATGNSYEGDFLWTNQSGGLDPAAVRFGSFMRPYERFPLPAENLLFWDTRLPQQLLSTTEWTSAHSGIALSVPAWHAPFGHNALFVDGHAATLQVNVTGSVYDPMQYPANFGFVREDILRGPGWRYDAMNDPVILEGFNGIPALTAPPQTTGGKPPNHPTVAPAVQMHSAPIRHEESPADH